MENFNSKEDLIEYINEKNFEDNKLYKINLVGNRHFEINTREILKLISIYNVLKIKDLTKLKYDLETIKNENTLRGLFVKEALEILENGIATEEEIEKAIEIGLNCM